MTSSSPFSAMPRTPVEVRLWKDRTASPANGSSRLRTFSSGTISAPDTPGVARTVSSTAATRRWAAAGSAVAGGGTWTLTALESPRFQLETASSTTSTAASASAARKTIKATIHGRKREVSSRSSGRSRDRRQGHNDSTRMLRPPCACG